MSHDTVYDTRGMLNVMLHRDLAEEDAKGFDDLQVLIRDFDRRVWATGLQDAVESNPNRGLSGLLDSETELLIFVLAGRVMLTFQKGATSFTALAAEREKPSRMGIHGIKGSINQAKELLQLAIKVGIEEGIRVEHDPEVTLGTLPESPA